MDTLTHIVLGACIGEVIAGKQLGKKALLLGAVAQNIPDIDFVASFWLPVSADLLAHRGFTHSILFAVILSPLLGFCCKQLFSKMGMTLWQWTFFWGLQIFVHIFIDAFNTYGTGWFEPFSHYRVSFNTMFVADPLFSMWPAIIAIILLILNSKNKKRKYYSITAITISALYLLIGVINKIKIDSFATRYLQAAHIPATDLLTTPTPLNNFLWYVVARSDSGYYIGYRSVFDKSGAIQFHYVSRNDSLLVTTTSLPDAKRLLQFGDGYYTLDKLHDTLEFNILRFGEMRGWEVVHPKFVFHYYLQYPDANALVLQRGRFEGWDRQAVTTFINRIKGN